MSEMITGGCLCGAVRYQAQVPPLVSRLCYGRACQYIAAGNATVNAVFPSAAITFTGEMREFVRTADSGNIMHRFFCPVCGTHICSRGEALPEYVVIRAGTLDDPNIASPSAAIWTSSAPRWACIDPKLEQVAKQPPPLKIST